MTILHKLIREQVLSTDSSGGSDVEQDAGQAEKVRYEKAKTMCIPIRPDSRLLLLDWPPSPIIGRLEAVRCRERLEVPTIFSKEACSLSISFASVTFAPPTCSMCQTEHHSWATSYRHAQHNRSS